MNLRLDSASSNFASTGLRSRAYVNILGGQLCCQVSYPECSWHLTVYLTRRWNVSLLTFKQGDCVVIENVLTNNIIDAVIIYTAKIEANLSERRQIAWWVGSACATITWMLDAASIILFFRAQQRCLSCSLYCTCVWVVDGQGDTFRFYNRN
jgi:hypothetical protein